MARKRDKFLRFPRDVPIETGCRGIIRLKGVLDPQEPFLQRLNKIFLLSCVLNLAWDPLFFYIPAVDGKNKCLKLDATLGIIACVLRTCSDLFYVCHIILQFRTGFIAPSSGIPARGVLVTDHAAIRRRYLFSYFIIDILSVLPLPQMAAAVLVFSFRDGITSKCLSKSVIPQYFLRIFRIYPLYKQVTRTSGLFIETAWAGAALNLLLYLLASHVVGASWYLFAIERQETCWRKSCEGSGCFHLSSYCRYQHQGYRTYNEAYCTLTQPDQITDHSTVFNFGMFYDALQSEVVKCNDFVAKLLYCFWWGLQNLSSIGQSLKTSTFKGENLFATFICVFGLVLFSLILVNLQNYLQFLQSTNAREEEMRLRRREVERWMSHRFLPKEMRERIRRLEQYRWQETRLVDEEKLISNLPVDLKRDTKRHICLALLMRVPLFEKLDEQTLDTLCDRLKPRLYTKNCNILRVGDPVNEMLFIMRGRLLSSDERTSAVLTAGDFCGEDLLTWAQDPHSFSSMAISTRAVQTKTEVEVFALILDDVKFVASQFRRVELRQAFKFYSSHWRLWAARVIQAAWRHHCRRNLERSLQTAEGRSD